MPTPNHIKAHIRPCLPEVSCGLVMIMVMIGVGQLSELSEGRPQMQMLQYTSNVAQFSPFTHFLTGKCNFATLSWVDIECVWASQMLMLSKLDISGLAKRGRGLGTTTVDWFFWCLNYLYWVNPKNVQSRKKTSITKLSKLKLTKRSSFDCGL